MDRTTALQRCSARCSVLVSGSLICRSKLGRLLALNYGIAEAASDVLLRYRYPAQGLAGSASKLLSNFADPSVSCVAGELVLNTDGHDGALLPSAGYWRYEQWIRNCEAADSPVGVYGGFYAVRRSLAQQFPAGIILDDMFQPLSIVGQGYRSVLDRSAIVRQIPGQAKSPGVPAEGSYAGWKLSTVLHGT